MNFFREVEEIRETAPGKFGVCAGSLTPLAKVGKSARSRLGHAFGLRLIGVQGFSHWAVVIGRGLLWGKFFGEELSPYNLTEGLSVCSWYFDWALPSIAC